MYAEVIVDISHEKVDKPFTYRITKEQEEKLKVGSVVRIPFGAGNKPRKGYVVALSEACDYDPSKIKELLSVDEKDVPIESQLLELADWMKRRYGGTLAQSLATVLPVKRRVKSRTAKDKKATPQMVAAGEGFPKLSDEQQEAVDRFREDLNKKIHNEYLLYGVTGSGKTRVYIEMMRTVIAAERSVIVLIPEIALTTQNINRFTEVFGDKVAVLHSRLSGGERYEVYEKAKSGDISIILGPRSALFAPFSDLGLIIVDEEHEISYKSEQVPKYNAKEVARKRARMAGASLVLGTATPEISTMKRAVEGRSVLLRLNKRIADRPMPAVRVVDMRDELKRGNRTMFSDELYEAMSTHLKEDNQIMLFLNRRGVNGFVSCRSCGLVLKCPHCDVSLHQHKDGFVRCHYCGYRIKLPNKCPKCSSKYIGGFRAGTQSVESAIGRMFPEARVLRMDADTTSKKGAHDKILKSFAAGKADILLGTQMIVKGHDFPGVTLVGILAADLSLNDSDYTSAERTYDLLTQAAGRAGRGERCGEVIIQTYQPDNYAIKAAAEDDYEGFYNKELGFRRLMHYPPEGHILLIQISDKSADVAYNEAKTLANMAAASKADVMIAGPNEAVISKLKDRYRYAIYIKADVIDELIRVKDFVEGYSKELKTTRVQFDFDPIGIY